jgi:hypothetical protein
MGAIKGVLLSVLLSAVTAAILVAIGCEVPEPQGAAGKVIVIALLSVPIVGGAILGVWRSVRTLRRAKSGDPRRSA